MHTFIEPVPNQSFTKNHLHSFLEFANLEYTDPKCLKYISSCLTSVVLFAFCGEQTSQNMSDMIRCLWQEGK